MTLTAIKVLLRKQGDMKNPTSDLPPNLQPFASLLDTLLPKLISGELRVPDAEQFLDF